MKRRFFEVWISRVSTWIIISKLLITLEELFYAKNNIIRYYYKLVNYVPLNYIF